MAFHKEDKTTNTVLKEKVSNIILKSEVVKTVLISKKRKAFGIVEIIKEIIKAIRDTDILIIYELFNAIWSFGK